MRRFPIPLAVRHGIDTALTAVVYGACASLALQLTRIDGGVAIVWLAGPLLFAKLCSIPRRRWTALTLACVPTGLLASAAFGIQGAVAIPLPLVCIAEAYAAAWLIKRWYPRFGRFQSVREVACFLVVTGILVPAVMALAGAFCVHVGKGIAYWPAWRDWYAGHALGMVAFAPPLLLTLRGDISEWIRSADRRRASEAIGLLGSVAALSLVTFGQDTIPLVILPFLPMIAATVRLGRFGAVNSIVILMAIGLPFSLAGMGPTALLHVGMALRLQVLQIYFASIVLILLPLAAELWARRRLLDRMRTAEAFHRLVLDRTSDVVLRLGRKGTVRYASPSIEQVWGYRPDELIGRKMFHLISAEDLPAVLDARRGAVAAPEKTAITEYRVHCRNGGTVWMESHMRAIVDEHDAVIGTVSIAREVTSRRKLMEDLTHQATTDPLTGVHNRRAFDETLPALLASASTEATLGCLAVFDLDHFKRINDQYGHSAGDIVLQRFAALLRSCVRDGDLVARLGGEEFAVIFAGVAIDQARLVCERVRKQFETSVMEDPSGAVIRATVSVGISSLLRGQTSAAAMQIADAALYAAKQAGRNRAESA